MNTSSAPSLKPIGLFASILYFGIPSAIFCSSILGLLPWMLRNGYSSYLTFNVTFGAPLILMLIAAVVAYRLEGRPWSWPAFRDRMRLTRPTAKDWLWTAGLVAATFVLGWALGPVIRLFDVRLYTPPAEFTTFMATLRDGTFGLGSLTGRWDVLLWVVFSLVVFNIGGEELWWRGIILPRQEVALGKWAWVVNGLLWDLFHFFYHSNLGNIVGYLPILALPFVAQRLRNTWPGIVAHLIANGALPVAVAMKVLGH